MFKCLTYFHGSQVGHVCLQSKQKQRDTASHSSLSLTYCSIAETGKYLDREQRIWSKPMSGSKKKGKAAEFLLLEAARFASRGEAGWFSIMWSNNAPVALCPPSVSQYSGIIAKKKGKRKHWIAIYIEYLLILTN